jgi:hypothetical protein
MKRLMSPSPCKVLLLALVTLFGTMPRPVYAESPIEVKKLFGSVGETDDGITPFVLSGTASHLGRFSAYGEVEFVPGEEPGWLLGTGVVVFEAADGDLLVGNVVWQVAPGDEYRATRIDFTWRDSVRFDDGTVVFSTGQFAEVDGRPAGLVVIAIITILAAILFPVF